MMVEISRIKNVSVRASRVSGMFAAAVLTSVATAALTSIIFLSAFSEEIAAPQPSQLAEAPAQSQIQEEPLERSVSQEERVISVVQRVAPAVVSVVATKDLPIIEQYFVDPFEDFGPAPLSDDLFGPFQFRIPQYRERGTERREIGGGTGFIVSSDGLILTNRHVVDIDEADFTVIFADGEKVPAEVLAIDPIEDLAVLRIERDGLPVIPFGDSGALRIGQSVIAIGNALGEFQNTVSVGVISGMNRRITAGGPGGFSVIEGALQTDAAINPGNSGGPLLNLRGEVIGVNTALAIGQQNIGFAIPINKAKKAVGDVKEFGKISYAYLGVRYVPVTAEIQEGRDLSVDYGALILGSADGRHPGVLPDSPAAEAGLREGDVILEIDGQRVDQEHQLATLIQQRQVGETVKLRVLSDGNERDVTVTLAERP